MSRITSLLIALVLTGCFPSSEQPQPVPQPTRVWIVSIGGLSKNHDAYANQSVRVKLPAGRYRVHGRAIVVPTVADPTMSLITFHCEDRLPLDSSRDISIRGIAQPLVKDDLNRGPGVAGEVVVIECTITAE